MEVVWIRSHGNFAAGLTNFAKSKALGTYMDDGNLETKVEQCIVREGFQR